MRDLRTHAHAEDLSSGVTCEVLTCEVLDVGPVNEQRRLALGLALWVSCCSGPAIGEAELHQHTRLSGP